METKRNNKGLNGTQTVFFIVVLFVCSFSYAQLSIGGGASLLSEFGGKGTKYGLNIIVEKPRNNETTFTGRMVYAFANEHKELVPGGGLPATAKDSSETISVPIYSSSSMDYLMLDFGTRTYIINGFDEGFSLYGGTQLGGILNRVKWGNTINYDDSKYTIMPSLLDPWRNGGEGSIIRFHIGLNGGGKYTIPNLGSFFFEAGVHLTPIVISSVDLPQGLVNSVFFNFNIGFRRELY